MTEVHSSPLWIANRIAEHWAKAQGVILSLCSIIDIILRMVYETCKKIVDAAVQNMK